MTVRLGPLVVNAVEPRAVERFWAAALGGPAQRGLLSFRQRRRAKTVKNRVHLDVYVRDVEALLELGARVLAEYLPTRMPLADVEGNEFSVTKRSGSWSTSSCMWRSRCLGGSAHR